MVAVLVSVVIPAFNAGDTLAETLETVLYQTHRELDIVVVDDGSSDGTGEVAAAAARRDSRVRLVRQPNAGVAAARNHGIDLALGEFIAPLDADDIWHETKIARQLQLFSCGPPHLGLVYNWYRPIDARSRVSGVVANPVVEGWVLHRHLDWNFVSNGSTPLLRRSALEGVRYDPGLMLANAGGCEDYLLQLQIASRWTFGCVPAALTGYRKAAGAMSSNVARMIRSHIAMYETLMPALEAPARALARRKIAEHRVELFRNRLRRRDPAAAGILAAALTDQPGATLSKLVEQARFAWSRARGRSDVPAGPPFATLEPTDTGPQWNPSRRRSWLASLEALDRDYGARRTAMREAA